MFRYTSRIPAAPVVAGGVLVLLTACGSAGGETGGHDISTRTSGVPAATASSQQSAVFNDADVMFAQMMIPHHEQAVEMAELADGRSSDPEVKDLAAKIKAAQEPEIQTMRGWLTAWGMPMPSGDMDHGMDHGMPGMMSGEQMAKLEAAKGAAFDRLFSELMIEHHNGAIEMARTEQDQGTNPEAKELAKTIETAQQAEVAQMQRILDRL
jgi:uncharacterized protein (DUF305 family)